MNPYLFLVPVALCPLAAQSVDAGAACLAALDSVKTAQSEDMGPVVTAVMEATGGDEQAYWRLMREAADAGHPVALTWLAKQLLAQVYAQGLDLEISPESQKLRAMLEKTTASGYVPAIVEMAHICGSGVGAPVDEKKGMEYLMQACKSNHSRARAAYLLLTGRLEKEGASSPAVTAELKRNNFYVEEFLGSLSSRVNEEKSREWMASAASHGSPAAAGLLAHYYLQQGKDAIGYEFLKQAVERDHPESLAQMGSLHLPDTPLQGELKTLVKPDVETAVKLFRRSVLLGYTPALIPLAGEYQKQPEKYSQSRVFELYRLAADAGDPRGGVAYAYFLVTGRGCTAETERGLRILRQLVDAGVPYANMALADLYFNGNGVPADMMKALSSLSSAAAAGVPQAYTLMAVISQLGNASKASDPSRAKLYLRMATERGELDPQRVFDEMLKTGSWKFIP